MTLAELKPKQKGVIIKVNCARGLSMRLAEMGIVKGVEVEFDRVAPLGDPIKIKVKGYHLSLRKEDAVNIIISENKIMEKVSRLKMFKHSLKKLWYKYILRREYKVGWKLTGPKVVILNDKCIIKITIDK